MITLKTLPVIATVLTVFYSFNPSIEKNPDNTVKNPITSIATGNKSNLQRVVEEEYLQKPSTVIKFKEISLSIRNFSTDGENSKIVKVQKDTVSINAEIGETIEGQLISIISNQLNNLTIEQRYETSVAITNEGPHCDLVDWEHYYSDWKPLKRNKNKQFVCNKYTETESQKFPEVQIDNLKKEVKEQCGEEWFKLVENIKKPTELPSTVGISRHFLRIKGKRKDNGKTVIKLITITQPLGC